jgi:ABC-type glutathione transport system ATPase component
VIANPAAAIADVKARDGIINTDLETRRLKLAIDTVINSPNARAEGFGQVNVPPPVADGVPGVGRVQHQDPGQSGRGLERPASCPPSKAELDVPAQEISNDRNDAATIYSLFRRLVATSGSPTTRNCWKNHFAVEAIDLKVRQGEFIAIVGPSGCGKSTFMKLTTGLKMPSMGKILIDGSR